MPSEQTSKYTPKEIAGFFKERLDNPDPKYSKYREFEKSLLANPKYKDRITNSDLAHELVNAFPFLKDKVDFETSWKSKAMSLYKRVNEEGLAGVGDYVGGIAGAVKDVALAPFSQPTLLGDIEALFKGPGGVIAEDMIKQQYALQQRGRSEVAEGREKKSLGKIAAGVAHSAASYVPFAGPMASQLVDEAVGGQPIRALTTGALYAMTPAFEEAGGEIVSGIKRGRPVAPLPLPATPPELPPPPPEVEPLIPRKMPKAEAEAGKEAPPKAPAGPKDQLSSAMKRSLSGEEQAPPKPGQTSLGDRVAPVETYSIPKPGEVESIYKPPENEPTAPQGGAAKATNADLERAMRQQVFAAAEGFPGGVEEGTRLRYNGRNAKGEYTFSEMDEAGTKKTGKTVTLPATAKWIKKTIRPNDPGWTKPEAAPEVEAPVTGPEEAAEDPTAKIRETVAAATPEEIQSVIAKYKADPTKAHIAAFLESALAEKLKAPAPPEGGVTPPAETSEPAPVAPKAPEPAPEPAPAPAPAAVAPETPKKPPVIAARKPKAASATEKAPAPAPAAAAPSPAAQPAPNSNESALRQYKNWERKVSKLPRKQQAVAILEYQRDIYTPGNVLDIGSGRLDRVLDYKEGARPLEFRVQVQRVDAAGNPLEPERWHMTPPNKFTRVVERAASAAPPASQPYAYGKNPLPTTTPAGKFAVQVIREVDGKPTWKTLSAHDSEGAAKATLRNLIDETSKVREPAARWVERVEGKGILQRGISGDVPPELGGNKTKIGPAPDLPTGPAPEPKPAKVVETTAAAKPAAETPAPSPTSDAAPETAPVTGRTSQEIGMDLFKAVGRQFKVAALDEVVAKNPELKPLADEFRAARAAEVTAAQERLKAVPVDFAKGEQGYDTWDEARTQIFKDLVTVGRDFFEKGLLRFEDWKIAMHDFWGDKILPWLDDLWNHSRSVSGREFFPRKGNGKFASGFMIDPSGKTVEMHNAGRFANTPDVTAQLKGGAIFSVGNSLQLKSIEEPGPSLLRAALRRVAEQYPEVYVDTDKSTLVYDSEELKKNDYNLRRTKPFESFGDQVGVEIPMDFGLSERVNDAR